MSETTNTKRQSYGPFVLENVKGTTFLLGDTGTGGPIWLKYNTDQGEFLIISGKTYGPFPIVKVKEIDTSHYLATVENQKVAVFKIP